MKLITAGESHGKGLVGILEGIPAGLVLNIGQINAELRRRADVYGRSERMQLEDDRIELLAGVRGKVTIGSPIAFFIKNNDYREQNMSPEGSVSGDPLVRVRPGHADLAGMQKYGFADARLIAERASGRETAARVAAGAILKQLLSELSISLGSHVLRIGSGDAESFAAYGSYRSIKSKELTGAQAVAQAAAKNSLLCLDGQALGKMKKTIDNAASSGISIGGEAEIIASGMPAGIGSHVYFERRLDNNVAGNIMSIPSVKAVSIGLGAGFCSDSSECADSIAIKDGRTTSNNNFSGGIDGGISTGDDIVVRITVKPVPTTRQGTQTIDVSTGRPAASHSERSDFCIVPAVSVVAESVLAYTLSKAILCDLGGDDMMELKERLEQKKERGNCLK